MTDWTRDPYLYCPNCGTKGSLWNKWICSACEHLIQMNDEDEWWMEPCGTHTKQHEYHEIPPLRDKALPKPPPPTQEEIHAAYIASMEHARAEVESQLGQGDVFRGVKRNDP